MDGLESSRFLPERYIKIVPLNNPQRFEVLYRAFGSRLVGITIKIIEHFAQVDRMGVAGCGRVGQICPDYIFSRLAAQQSNHRASVQHVDHFVLVRPARSSNSISSVLRAAKASLLV